VTAELFTRWFLAGFFTFVAAFYTTAILRKSRRMGVSPVRPGAAGSLHLRVRRTFVVFRAAIWAVCVARALYPPLDRWLLPIPWLWSGRVMLTGVGLLTLSFAAIIVLHVSMREAWRSGIDETGPAELIATGAFGVSRNPIFLCIQLAQFGFFLALPSLFSAICLAVGIAAIQTQVRSRSAISSPASASAIAPIRRGRHAGCDRGGGGEAPPPN
jgi:protein-S-isoprenylcysteine O-methyltransferase Ste14